MWAQEVSAIPQLDGPGSLLMKDPIGRRMASLYYLYYCNP